MKETTNKAAIIRYSTAFKHKVINEIETGKISKEGARKIYGIGGGSTIQNWIKKLGKLHMLNKVVRIEMKNEPSKLKELEKEKQELERALAQAHMKLLAYETLIEVAEENLGVDLKKNLRFPQFPSQNRKARRANKKSQ